MKYLLLGIFSFFFLVKILANGKDTIYLRDNSKQTISNENERYFFSKKDLLIEKVLNEEFKAKKDIKLSYITGWVWVKLIIKNQSETENFVLHTSDGHIAGLYMYKPSPSGYKMTTPKLHHPEDGREIYNRIPTFFLKIKKNETQTVYLKISTLNEIVNFNYIIQDDQHYVESVQLDYMIIGLYFGALIFIFVINIFYFISLKDSLFLVYSTYILSCILVTMTLNGFTWLLIPSPTMSYHVSYFCLRFWPDSLLFFTIQLVNLRIRHKTLTIIGYIFIFYHSIVMTIFDYVNFYNIRENLMAQWETINWGISVLIIILIVVISYKNNRYLFKYYLVAYGVLSIMFVFLCMQSLNAKNWLFFEHAMKAGTLIEIITLSFAVSRRFKLTENDLKKKKEEEQQLNEKVKRLEMDVRKAQMNPHFMFNALTSIEYFIFKNDSKKARNYLNKFAQLMRLTLDNSRSNYIPLEDELDALKLYIELEFLRLKNYAHHFEINIGNEINQDAVSVPALLMQPFVENAIWHGLQKKEEAGKLIVEIQLKNKELICIIEDDGGGVKKLEMSTNRKSSGILITKERLTLIHALLKTTSKFNMENIKNEKGETVGTHIQFNMPYVME